MMKKIFLLALTLFGLILGTLAQQYPSLNNEEIAKILTQKRVQVVDVRTAQEFQSAHLPNAIHIDVNQADFEARLSVLKKRYPVVVYCRSGRRSKKAAEKMASLGYKVYEMDKGIINWPGEKVTSQPEK